jgi:hypothetical protein
MRRTFPSAFTLDFRELSPLTRAALTKFDSSHSDKRKEKDVSCVLVTRGRVIVKLKS